MSEISSHNENTGEDVHVIDAVSLQKILPDRYKVLEVIGHGGAGVVYKARDSLLAKVVAIKTLHHSANPNVAVRFQREAKLAGSLNHPNVLSVIDFGLTEMNDPYLVLEYVRGESLAERLKRKGALPVAGALDLFLQIASGLAHAHSRSIIHRDIKPSNVMLVKKDGRIIAQIVDFGLAKSSDESQQLTAPGAGLGTPTYMSPEQIRGTELDQRSDIYSFGCLMFQTLTGQPPFLGRTALDTINMHLNDEPPALSNVSSTKFTIGLNATVLRCLEKDADDRFATVEEITARLKDEVALLQFAEELEEPSESVEENTDKKKLSGREVTVACVVAFSVLVAMGGYVLVQNATKEPTRARKEIDDRIFENTESNDPKYHFVLCKPTEKLWRAAIGTTNEQLAKFVVSPMHGREFSLDLSMSDVTPAGLGALNHCEIRTLIYRTAGVTHKSLGAISKIKSLDLVELGETDEIDPSAIRELRALPALRGIGLNQVQITQTILENICTVEALSKIDLARSTGLSSLNWECCRALKNLREVNLNDSDIDAASIKRLRCLDNVRRIDLIKTGVNDDCLAQLALMKSLKQIQIQIRDNCTEKGFQILRKHQIEPVMDTGAKDNGFGESIAK